VPNPVYTTGNFRYNKHYMLYTRTFNGFFIDFPLLTTNIYHKYITINMEMSRLYQEEKDVEQALSQHQSILLSLLAEEFEGMT
jgi:hypothetical protein